MKNIVFLNELSLKLISCMIVLCVSMPLSMGMGATAPANTATSLSTGDSDEKDVAIEALIKRLDIANRKITDLTLQINEAYKKQGKPSISPSLVSYNTVTAYNTIDEKIDYLRNRFAAANAKIRSLENELNYALKAGLKMQNQNSNTAASLPSQSGGNQTLTVNGVSFTMVAVQGGTFTMGATSEQGSEANDYEKPAHQVQVSSFLIGQTEVTQELWQAVMGSNPSHFNGKRTEFDWYWGEEYEVDYGTNLKRPVESVSWDDCQEFITKLNQLTGKQFRLPTEAEWEYAARGCSKSRGYKFSGSNTIGDVAWYSDNSEDKTHSVATKQANELGIYDMSGNVWEWCQNNWYNYDGSATKYGSNRVSRGCSWYFNARYCRVSYRGYGSPVHRSDDLGLRLAL